MFEATDGFPECRAARELGKAEAALADVDALIRYGRVAEALSAATKARNALAETIAALASATLPSMEEARSALDRAAGLYREGNEAEALAAAVDAAAALSDQMSDQEAPPKMSEWLAGIRASLKSFARLAGRLVTAERRAIVAVAR